MSRSERIDLVVLTKHAQAVLCIAYTSQPDLPLPDPLARTQKIFAIRSRIWRRGGGRCTAARSKT